MIQDEKRAIDKAIQMCHKYPQSVIVPLERIKDILTIIDTNKTIDNDYPTPIHDVTTFSIKERITSTIFVVIFTFTLLVGVFTIFGTIIEQLMLWL
ncbi:MAG: hypothetical protein HOG49_13150 [Candidatus Scalindua sp.]|jgi:hypothetical protein|nr:hypothetical protein [Candidatus Scalindua sp.]